MAPDDRQYTDYELATIAQQARWLALTTVTASKAGHVGGPMSAMDVLVHLYFKTLRIRPEDPEWVDRDRFILSKGHSSIALYTTLALRGYFSVDELATFDKGNSRLQGHPDMTRLPGVDMSTGSLGQGLAVGLGMALAGRKQGRDSRFYVMLGDGEIQEGMVWESVNVASRYRVGHLTAIIDHNGLQQYGWPKTHSNQGPGDRADPWGHVDLAGVLRSFGWDVLQINGHSHVEIDEALNLTRDKGPTAAPTAIIAKTVKGRGLSFAEGTISWHVGIATDEQLTIAAKDLGIETGREP